MSVSILKIKDKDGNWIPIESIRGENGADGLTPYIKNATWWIGDIDTGVRAEVQESKFMATGSYVGTGDSTTLTFDFEPNLLIISYPTTSSSPFLGILLRGSSCVTAFYKGSNGIVDYATVSATTFEEVVTFSENSVSFTGFGEVDVTYRYVAIGGNGYMGELPEIVQTTGESKTAVMSQKAVTEEVNTLKSDLSKIVENEELILHKADLSTTYDSTYVNEGYIGSSGGFTTSSDYRTYYMQATEDMSVYLTPTIGNPALTIAVYNTAISRTNFVARYRNNDSNLPTTDNRLSISSGQWIAVTFGYSSQADRDFSLGTGIIISSATPTNDFVDNLQKYLFVGKATKTATALTVEIGKLKYEVNRYDVSSIRAYLWRTNACRVLDNNGEYQTIWADSDSDGVVKIRGEADFIGGYHGDETETFFKLFVDGVEYSEDASFTNLAFDEIVLYFESDVYHCNTSATPDVVAFKRNKIIKFNNEGYTVENYWTAQEDLTCEISYMGMLSVENGLINGYSTNDKFKYYALGDNRSENSANVTEVCFMTPYGDIGINTSGFIPSANYKCTVSTYTERLKVYASNFSSSAHGSLNAGDILKGKSVIWFKG